MRMGTIRICTHSVKRFECKKRHKNNKATQCKQKFWVSASARYLLLPLRPAFYGQWYVYEALVIQLNEWAAGQTPVAWSTSAFYR